MVAEMRGSQEQEPCKGKKWTNLESGGVFKPVGLTADLQGVAPWIVLLEFLNDRKFSGEFDRAAIGIGSALRGGLNGAKSLGSSRGLHSLDAVDSIRRIHEGMV
jgi:hypothetical protein